MYFLVLLSALLACAAGVPLNKAKPKPDGRIVGGTETDITSHPYQVAVLLNGNYTCSGSIINKDWVITLADCVYWNNISELTVRSGSTYSNSSGNLHDVKKVIAHGWYNWITLDYDVALLQVSPAFTFSTSVQSIALVCDAVPEGTDVVVTGWGSTSETDDYTTILRDVTLQIKNDFDCNSTYASLGGITDRMICAGPSDGVKGACGGDYGGPLVSSEGLVGFYIWGVGCGRPQYPGVYMKVSAVCDWIAETVIDPTNDLLAKPLVYLRSFLKI